MRVTDSPGRRRWTRSTCFWVDDDVAEDWLHVVEIESVRFDAVQPADLAPLEAPIPEA